MARRRRRAKASRGEASLAARAEEIESTAIWEATSPAAVLELGVPPRQELVIGKNDVAVLASQGCFASRQMEQVAAGPRGGQLSQTAPRALDRRAEQHDAVLDGRTQRFLRVGQELEA